MAIIKLARHLETKTGVKVFAYEADAKSGVPYVVYQINDQSERLAVNGGVIQTDYLIELDIYTKTFKESETLKEKIINALLEFERPVTSIKCDTDKEDGFIFLTIELEFFV